jgi:hypothetical protein
MESAKELWFWLKSVTCPILILSGLYVVGNLVGRSLALQSGLPTIDSTHLVPMAGAICALNVLYYTWKEAKICFAVKHN